MKIEIKIVNRKTTRVDFDDKDAYEWGVYAYRANAWRMTCDVEQARIGQAVGVAVAIAAPDGRVAVWYGAALLRIDPSGVVRTARITVNKYEAALAALDDPAAAALWDARRTRGGDRDVTPLASAACRILHAKAYGDTPTLRDILLAPFAALVASRPPTPHLLRASEDELLAANALLDIGNRDGARALLARKGVAA